MGTLSDRGRRGPRCLDRGDPQRLGARRHSAHRVEPVSAFPFRNRHHLLLPVCHAAAGGAERLRFSHLGRRLIPTNIQIANLNQDDRRNIISYLQRRSQLTNREQVAVMVAQPIAERMGIPGSVSSLNRAEMFLEYVARAFELADS